MNAEACDRNIYEYESTIPYTQFLIYDQKQLWKIQCLCGNSFNLTWMDLVAKPYLIYCELFIFTSLYFS